MCWKNLRIVEGLPLSGTCLHDLRANSVFTANGRKGKLVRKGVGSCTVRWAKTTRRFNVGTRRYRTKHSWGRSTEVSPCMEVTR